MNDHKAVSLANFPFVIRHLLAPIFYFPSSIFHPLTAFLLLALFPSLACVIGGSGGTAIPVGRPASFEVQTATPTLNPQLATPTLEPAQAEPEVVLPLGSAPTDTPDPNATATSLLIPVPTPTPTPVVTPTIELTPTVAITQEVVVVAPTPRPVVEPDPPLQGGDWDFETDFIPWPNPYGEPCPGARVASGWTAFVEDGPYGSSCMNENLYQPNVFSGLKSQEMTFDFIAANSGVRRTIPTKVGHRYTIVAHAKHDRSIAPVQMALGVDFTGGGDWTAPTVQWFAWDNPAEDTWNPTEETVTASGESMTIFIKGFHPMADQGGKTVIDTVSVTDLGPE
ncbi:MAG: hypothetical protein BroJett011_20040 [Chloroflexota bacterium]|nr:MAG: hypothetical protein BroJett011_20040 [Chloroflexota bacterium]